MRILSRVGAAVSSIGLLIPTVSPVAAQVMAIKAGRLVDPVSSDLVKRRQRG